MSKVIAQVEDLHLVFPVSTLKSWSLREEFVRMTQNPISYWNSSKERLYVLQGLNLTVKQGDRIGLLGKNGAGKSSFCRCLTGHYSPTRGKIRINGRARGIFDTTVGLYPELTGRENAKILLNFLYPESINENQKMLEDIVEFSQLKEFIDMPFRIYSNGMQARLCLSLVTCRPCDLLILDEVFDGADQFFREKMSERMIDLAHKSQSVIFVSHSQDQIKKLCNRVLVLKDGHVAFDGAPEEGLHFYETQS